MDAINDKIINFEAFKESSEYNVLSEYYMKLMKKYHYNDCCNNTNSLDIMDYFCEKWGFDPRKIPPINYNYISSDVVYQSLFSNYLDKMPFVCWNLHLNGITSNITFDDFEIALFQKEPIIRI